MANKIKSTKPMDFFAAKKVKKIVRFARKTTSSATEQAKAAIKNVSDQVSGTADVESENFEVAPITSETVAANREEILSKARRFIYPLRNRRRVIVISIAIVMSLVVTLVVLTGVLLYGFKSTNSLTYNLSRFVPFPVARVDGEFVRYESYLFEVRSALHYYTNYAQEGIDIDSDEAHELVKDTKMRILDKVQRDELGLQLASEYDIQVSASEIDAEVERQKIEGGIDQSEGSLENVLASFYGWDVRDHRRAVKLQLMKDKLKPILNDEANDTLEIVLGKLAGKTKFSDIAKKYSGDKSSTSGGALGTIERGDTAYTEREQTLIFSLKAGEVSNPITLGDGYYIYKVNKVISEGKVDVSRIVIPFFDIDAYLSEQLESVAHRAYIKP